MKKNSGQTNPKLIITFLDHCKQGPYANAYSMLDFVVILSIILKLIVVTVINLLYQLFW